MPEPNDYYALLHIRPDAPQALVKASYKTLMQKLKMHPDLGGNEAIASQINNAYAILSDEKSRAEYDHALKRHKQSSSHNRSSTATPKESASAEPVQKRVMWNEPRDKQTHKCLFCEVAHSLGDIPPLLSLCKSCECPLAPTHKRDLLPGERRALDRLQLERQIYFRTHPLERHIQTTTSDLSLSGLRFQTDVPLVVDQLVQIRSLFCLALGRVTHFSEGPKYGIEFVTLCFPNTSGSIVSERA